MCLVPISPFGNGIAMCWDCGCEPHWKVNQSLCLVTENNGEVLYIEVKGVETPKFRRDMKLWRAYGPGTLYVVARKGKKWVQTHKIVPGEPAPKRKRKNRQ